MKFNMTKCLECFSLALDFAEVNYIHVNPNHSRRVAYIALNMAKVMGFSEDDIKDLFALSLLHDNGLTLAGLRQKEYELIPEHCLEGEINISHLPLIKRREDVIKYHHENHDGTGIFMVGGDDVPLFSQLIHLPDVLDTTFDLQRIDLDKKKEIIKFVKDNKGTLFSPAVADVFLSLADKERLWADLFFCNATEALNRIVPQITYEYTWEDIFPISETFMKIIDSKSKFTYRHSLGITQKVEVMADYYNLDPEKKKKLHIAANLHDLGKLYVANVILEKPAPLDEYEYHEVKKHSYFTRLALDKIPGFEDISRWAGNHHEKLNGKGYPESLSDTEIDFESRLVAVIDIYQALTEDRPYRLGVPHKETMEIINDMAYGGYLDKKIAHDVDDIIGGKAK
jgi:HD-GYP domain-containing protein (c-di-GMP phosphodiesterase class II)